jgi:class 3 adenylate cyclase
VYLPRSTVHRILALTLPGGIALGLFLYALVDVAWQQGDLGLTLRLIVALLFGGVVGLALSIAAWISLRYALGEVRDHARRILQADLPPLTDDDPLVTLRQTVADAIAAVPRSATLTTLASRLNTVTDREEMLTAVAESLSEHLAVRGAVFLLYDVERAVLVPSTAWGVGKVNRTTIFDINGSAIGRALRERRSVRFSSVQMRELINTASPQALTVISWPLWGQQTPIGALCIMLAGADVRLNDEQLLLFEQVAMLFTAYLQTSIYRQWAERDQRRLAIFEHITESMAEQPNLERALVHLLRIAAEITESDHGSFLLIDADTSTIRMRVTLSGGDVLPLNLASVPILKHGLAGWVLRARRGAIIDDIERDTRWVPTPGLELMRSALAVPLFHGDRPLGVLTLADPAPYHYSQRAMALVSVLAAYAVTMLVHYRYEGIIEPEQQAHARQILEKHLDPETMRELIAQRAKLMQAIQPQVITVTLVYGSLRNVERLTSLTAQQWYEDLASAFHSGCRLIVYQHQGAYMSLDERSFSAAFGFPQPQFNDGVRALQAAQQIQATVARLRIQWRQQIGADLPLAIGITTGQLIVGVVGRAQSATMMWSGKALREARRLCQLARNDEIVVSDTVLKTVPSGQFTLDPLTPANLHNGTEMAPLYRLVGNT